MSANASANASSCPNPALWVPIYQSTNFFYKHVSPFFSIAAVIGSLLLLLILLARRVTTKLPATANAAICCLLAVDALYLIVKVTADFGVGQDPKTSIRGVCLLSVIATFSFSTLQGYLQVIISVERVLAIVMPLRVKTLVTRRRMAVALVLTVCGVVALHTTVVLYPYGNEQSACGSGMFAGPRRFAYAMVDTVFYCAIPSAALVACTVIIVLVLTRRQRQMNKNEVRLAMILVVVDIVYVITSVPITVYFHTMAFDPNGNCVHVVFWYMVVAMLTRFGATTDFLVFLVLGRQIRVAIREVVRPTRSKNKVSNTFSLTAIEG